jgi:predicted MFS family arabinose efflux permease
VVANFIPQIIISPFSGAITDRSNYLRMFMIAECTSASIPISIGIFNASDLMSIWLLIGLIFLRGSSYSFARPARLALVYNLVGRDDISAASSINAIIFNASRFIGPAVGGAVIIAFGVTGTFFATAITLSFQMVCLLMIRPPDQETFERKSGGLMGEAWDGMRYTFTHQGIAPLLIILVLSSILARPFLDLLPGFADRVFGRGADGLAILMSANGVGAMIAGFWMASRSGIMGMTKIMTSNVAIFSVSLILFCMTDVIEIAVVIMVVTGFTMVAQGVSTQVLIQSGVSGEYRGRVLGVYGLVARVGPAIGAVGLGVLTDYFGMQWPLAIGGALCLLLWGWARLRRDRMIGFLEGDAEQKGSMRDAAG